MDIVLGEQVVFDGQVILVKLKQHHHDLLIMSEKLDPNRNGRIVQYVPVVPIFMERWYKHASYTQNSENLFKKISVQFDSSPEIFGFFC